MYKILHFHEEVTVKTDIPSFLFEKKDNKISFRLNSVNDLSLEDFPN